MYDIVINYVVMAIFIPLIVITLWMFFNPDWFEGGGQNDTKPLKQQLNDIGRFVAKLVKPIKKLVVKIAPDSEERSIGSRPR